MLPKPISVLNAPFDTFARRCKPTCTVHNRPPMPEVCSICIAPLFGVANADNDGEGGDYTERAGEVAMPPDLEQEVRNRLGPNRFNRLVNPSRLRAPPDMWAPRHQEGRPDSLMPVQSLSCDHWFHQECIMQWASSNPHCPQCRLPIRADDLRDMGLGDAVAPAPGAPGATGRGSPLTVPEARAQLEQARVHEREVRQVADDMQRARSRIHDDSIATYRQQQQAAQAELRQRRQVDRLRVSVAKQQLKKYDQVRKDNARRQAAVRKHVLVEAKLARAEEKRALAMQRGFAAGEEERIMRSIAVANSQLDSAQATLRGTPEAILRHEEEAGAVRGKLFLLLRKHQLMLAEADARLEAEIADSKRLIWYALRILRDMYADSDAMQEDRHTNGLARSIYMHVQEGYDETEARVPNLTSSTIDDVLARTFGVDLWGEGGRYNIDIAQGHHWYVDSTYAEVTRGLWIVDPLVPLPDETEAPRWPPAPQGAVTIPSEVSIWFPFGVPSVWRPSNLHARPAPEEPAPPLDHRFGALTEEERAFISERYGQEYYEAMAVEVQATILATARAAFAAVNILDAGEPQYDPTVYDEGELERLATRDAQRVLVSRIEAIINTRELRGLSAGPNTVMMRHLVSNLSFIIARWDRYPEPTSGFWPNFQTTRDGFLAAVEQDDLWSRLGGTEAVARAVGVRWMSPGRGA